MFCSVFSGDGLRLVLLARGWLVGYVFLKGWCLVWHVAFL